MIITDLNYVETVDAKVEGGAFATSFALAINVAGFAAASTDNTAGFFIADSDSSALAVGVGNFATAGGTAISTI